MIILDIKKDLKYTSRRNIKHFFVRKFFTTNMLFIESFATIRSVLHKIIF